MNKVQKEFINNAQKIHFSTSSMLVLACSLAFLFLSFYCLGHINKLTSDSRALYALKEKINHISLTDEMIYTLTYNNLKTNSNINQSEYDLIYPMQMQNLFDIFHYEISEEFTKTIEEIKISNHKLRAAELQIYTAFENQTFTEIMNTASNTNYKNLYEINRQNLVNLQTLALGKITESELKSKNYILVIFVFMLLVITLFIVFLALEIKKINASLQQAHKLKNEKDEAQEHMITVGELTAGINHEIKNVLCIAGLHSHLLANKLKKQIPITPEDILKAVQRIETSVSRAEKIIKSVSKLSYDSTFLEKKECALSEIFMDTEEFADYFAKKNEVELRIESLTTRLKIHCHPIQISQVLLNLIKNSTEAIENLEEKWVELKAEWNESEKQVIIYVIDSGSGIPESVREKLFQKQFSTKAPGKGTGLGLSISIKIIYDHGGELYIDDKAEHTTFVIKLPAFLTAPPQGFAVDKAS